MKKILVLSLTLLLIICTFVPCNAEDFYLEKSSVVDGDVNVAKDVTIELNFSSNMVDISIANHNKDCFSLVDENGSSIPIKLIFPDTQMQSAYKKQAFIRAIDNLEMGKTYYLNISQNLIDKNGNKLAQDYQIKFTVSTDETLTTTPNQILENLGEDVTIYSVENTTNPGINETTTTNATNKTEDSQSNNILFIISIVAIVFILFFVSILIKKKK